MAETYIAEAQSTDPDSGMSILDIVKLFNQLNNKEYSARLEDLNDLLSEYIRPEFENIEGDPYTNVELGAILSGLTRQVLLNTLEINLLHRLNAKLIFTLMEQGIKIEDKELINELKIYLK